eukprot:3240714-Rhodomonas_salina.1
MALCVGGDCCGNTCKIGLRGERSTSMGSTCTARCFTSECGARGRESERGREGERERGREGDRVRGRG